ncbi:hypothetical protein [Pseudomonas serbica]|uniref:hypothetical protein n=1 Tax=Pseudomonas serbica TaxID=2965074 RepID=UPI00237A0C38|nr:hypothetical protein [Pseudomonas serbica]
MKTFPKWFEKNYGTPAPAELLVHFSENPNGVQAEQGVLFTAKDMVEYTEERDLQEKGVLWLGTGLCLTVFLLRAKDGKVFLVDKADFQSVDASFKSLDTCKQLLALENPE